MADYMAASPLISAAVFLAGVLLVVWSAELFVENIAAAAAGAGVSTFFLSVLLAGTDVENVVLGGAANMGGLPGVAVGTVYGEAMFILCAALGLAGVLVPFSIRVPRRYLLLTLVSPLPWLALAADGELSRLDGFVLTAMFVGVMVVLFRWEKGGDQPFVRSEEMASDADSADAQSAAGRATVRHWLLVVVGLVGMTLGSELAVAGTHGVLSALHVDGMAFGATVVSFIASLEEIMLTVVPARRGRPEVGIGNVLGSMMFFATANIGIIALLRPVDVTAAYPVQWPMFLIVLAAVLVLLARGRITRLSGVLLLAVYLLYWLLTLAPSVILF
jgi:cation:H+ antiporter